MLQGAEKATIMYSSGDQELLHGDSAPSLGSTQMMMMILPPPFSSSSSRLHHMTLDDVVPGCFYVIDHSRIPPKYPDQIKQIRIVMVSEKTESRISLRFSSIYSLRCHFSRIASHYPRSVGVGKNNMPPLDEKYVINLEAARQLLLRRVPPEELAERKMAMDFWVAQSTSVPVVKMNSINTKGDVGGMCVSALSVSKKGSCWSELSGTDMVSWGKRRQVRFLNRHEEIHEDKTSRLLALTQGCEGKNDAEEEEEEDDDEVTENTEDEIEVKPPARPKIMLAQKRKRCAGGNGASASTKKRLIQSREKQVQVYARSNRRNAKATINRWSAERYKLAEENMLKIMKEKEAVFNNPIMRPALRTEARKLIGDTGLLDHLLKHMSGKLAPGGVERFRRRHNADGAMEYWLESADLVDLRRQAGVDDPFWTPPNGWKLGDNPSQDPACARDFRELREDVARLKREISQLAMAVFESQEGGRATVTARTSCDSSLDLEQVMASIISLKEMYRELSRKDSAREEQLREMSLSLDETKASMEELVAEMALSLKGMKEEKGKLERESILQQQMAMANNCPKDRGTQTTEDASAAAADEMMLVRGQKAEKLCRLRSGFKICTPHPLFPDNFLAVPTPPAISSSSIAAAASPLSQSSPQAGSPFKPMAVRSGDDGAAAGINLNY